VPTLLFFVVVLVILSVAPNLIWEQIDARTRQTGLLLAGALAVGFAVALGARWASPFTFTLDANALVAAPLIGSARRIPYGEIQDVTLLPKTFMRSVPEITIRPTTGRPITVRTDLVGYGQFEKGLRRRLAPDVQARWKEARKA
jgi:hypothetical protein